MVSGSGNAPEAFALRSLSSTAHGFFIMLKFSVMETRTTRTTDMLTFTGWLGMESKSFTALCGEKVTHSEVLAVMIGCMSLIPLACLIELAATWLAGGAA